MSPYTALANGRPAGQILGECWKAWQELITLAVYTSTGSTGQKVADLAPGEEFCFPCFT